MTRTITTILATLVLSLPAAAQVLTCTDAGSGDCHYYHYHVQSYNGDTRSFVELYGTNRFATIEACEAEKNRRMSIEKQAVGFVLKQAPRARVKESRFGPCHCDMTSDESNRYHLNDDARFNQMHRQREMALQLLEEAFDKGLTNDSEIAQGLASRPTSFAASLWPNTTEVPPDSPDRFLAPQAPEPKETEVSSVQTGQLDASRYVLADISFGDEIPLETIVIDEESEGIDAASEFVNAEIAEVQTHLPTVLDMGEGTEKERLLELIQQRVQLLSNLSRLVQTAGSTSALATGIASAETATERSEMIGRIFGDEVRTHWAPAEATDLLIDIPESVTTDPVAVLRDPGERFDLETRQLALYVFLMRTGALTENQEIWLSGLIESILAA